MTRILLRALTAHGRRGCAGVSIVGMLLVAGLSGGASLPAFCGELSRVPLKDWQAAIGPTPLARLLADWAVMLVAMVPPLFAEPMRHVWFASLRSRRAWAVLICAVGYFAVWMLAAPGLIAFAWVLQVALPANLALPVAVATALAWSVSPMSQFARNQCHRFLRVGASGRQADLECLGQGLFSGMTCVAVCWPWMALPMLVGGFAHVGAMLAVSLWLVLDRVFPARKPHWQWPPAVTHYLWQRRRGL